MRSLEPNASRRWTRARILQDYGHLTFSLAPSSHDLGSSGALYYIQRMAKAGKFGDLAQLSLSQILDMEQPGDLFVPLVHPVAKRALDEYLSKIVWPAPLSNIFLPLFTKGTRAVTLGVQGQWYQVHIHELAVYSQMRGRKGWVLIPHAAIPKDAGGKRGLPLNALAQIRYNEVCNHFKIMSTIGMDWVEEKMDDDNAIRNFTQHAILCEVRQGELLLVPGKTYWGGWWHGTCNMDDWNVGLSFIATNLDLWRQQHP